MEEVKLGYTRGTRCLQIPKMGHAPMLLLEWLAFKGSYKVTMVENYPEIEIVEVRIDAEEIGYKDCMKYINDNL